MIVVLLCGEFPTPLWWLTPLVVRRYSFGIRPLPSAKNVSGNDALPVANRLAARSLGLVPIGIGRCSRTRERKRHRFAFLGTEMPRHEFAHNVSPKRESLPMLDAAKFALALPDFARKFSACENKSASEPSATRHQCQTLARKNAQRPKTEKWNNFRYKNSQSKRISSV